MWAATVPILPSPRARCRVGAAAQSRLAITRVTALRVHRPAAPQAVSAESGRARMTSHTSTVEAWPKLTRESRSRTTEKGSAAARSPSPSGETKLMV